MSMIALLAVVQAVYADEPDIHISVAEITGCGIFEIASSRRHSGFSTTTMAADSVSGLRFTTHINEIPALQGINFGFEYSINSTPLGQKIPIRSIIRFPDPGLFHPGGKHYTESVEHKHVRIGERSLHGYGLDEPWEVVPGEWVFEIWYKDARLIRKTFSVVESTKE
jgi:hypothetical protein